MNFTTFLRKTSACLALLFILLPASARVVRIPSYYSYDYSSSDTPGITALYYESLMSLLADAADWEYDLMDLNGKAPIDAVYDGEVDLLYDVVRYDSSVGKDLYWGDAPSGTEYLMLVTKASNNKYNGTYLGNLNGAKIGYESRNYVMFKLLEAFLQTNKIQATPVPCDSNIDLRRQMDNDKIDLYVSTRTTPNPKEKIIYTFGHYPVYFLSSNREIISELNAARNKLYKGNPLYLENILVRASGMPSVDVANISTAERHYIQNRKTMKVMDDDFNYDGTNGQIRSEFWQHLTGITGLEFTFEKGSGSPSTYEEPCLYDAVITDKVRDTGIYYTYPYCSMGVRLLCAPGVNIRDVLLIDNPDYDTNRKLRLVLPPDMQKVLPYFSERFIPYETTVLSSASECLRYLSHGTYDVALINDFSLQQRFSINDYKKLRDQDIVVYKVPISIVAKCDHPDLITSILNKAFTQMPYDFYNSLQNEHRLYITREPSMEAVRYRIVNAVFIFFGIFILYNLLITIFHTRRYQKQIKVDQLTGLLSMTGFEQDAGKLIEHLPNDKFMLTELNVRDFSFINRLYGPGSGDRMLTCIARTLDKLYSQRKYCCMARGYADNFYIIQKVEFSVNDSLKDMAECQNILQEHLLSEEGFRVVVKCGNVIDFGTSDHPLNVKDMISKAGYARRSKQESMVENFSVFDNEIKKQREKEERIENSIAKALEENEFFIMLQPKMDLTGERCIGAEALVRWQTKENGVLTPDQFIPILEKNGYVAKVDFFVYRTVFNFIQQCLQEKIPMVPISLNISRLNHDSSTFTYDFNRLFKKYDISPRLVELEIDEHQAGGNEVVIKEMARALHEDGFVVCLDDFGTGDSSVNILSEIPVDVVKFDQRFLHYAEVSDNSRVILVSLIKMAHELNKYTICEGVETLEQVELLRSMKCDAAQGFYYARPMSLDNFKMYLMSHL